MFSLPFFHLVSPTPPPEIYKISNKKMFLKTKTPVVFKKKNGIDTHFFSIRQHKICSGEQKRYPNSSKSLFLKKLENI